MNRRTFLSRATAAAAGAAMLPGLGRAQAAGRPPRILLRSSWQSVNIGDIGHTPGALSVIEKHLPEAEITLWANPLGHGSRELLTRCFPKLKIVEAGHARDGNPKMAEIRAAWEATDFLLHGSGSGFPASGDVAAFLRATNKPAGVWGVSTDPMYGFDKGRDPEGGTLEKIRAQAASLPPTHLSETYRFILDRAAFMFTRDTISRDYLRAQGVKVPILEFGPDMQLGMMARDDAKGHAFLQKHGLEAGKFLCAIPRLRYTPYHKMGRGNDPAAVTAKKDEINARTAEADHAALREMIIAYVRQTGGKVLACPEMTYEIALAKEQLVDPLPGDVKARVVWREEYWLPDEAASIYAKARALVSLECHSPLIAYHVGTPAIHVRQPTDTCKGQMYRDIGAGEWFFEVEEVNGPQLWERVEAIHRAPGQAREKVKRIMAGVEQHQRRMVVALHATAAHERAKITNVGG